MNKDKKIELQQKIIQKLQSENDYLKDKLSELEDKEKMLIEYEKLVDELQGLKNKYIALVAKVTEEEKSYKQQFESFMKTLNKNMK